MLILLISTALLLIPQFNFCMSLSSENKNTKLREYIKDGRLARVKKIVADGAECNSRSQTGLTPLLVAVMGGRVEIAEFLLQRGAEPNYNDTLTKICPLSHAARNNDCAMIKMLLENRALVDGCSAKTPLMDAAERRSFEAAHYLLSQRAQVNALDENGFSALAHAVLVYPDHKFVALFLSQPLLSLRRPDESHNCRFVDVLEYVKRYGIHFNDNPKLAEAYKKTGRMILVRLGVELYQGRISKKGLGLPADIVRSCIVPYIDYESAAEVWKN